MNKKKLLIISTLIIILTLGLSSILINAGNSDKTEWETYTDYKVNQKVSFENNIYSCIQSHTSLPGWEPVLTPALWKLESGTNTTKVTEKPTTTSKVTLKATSKTTPKTTPKTTSKATSTTLADNNNDSNDSGSWNSKIFAPYVDVCLYPAFDLNNCYDKTGQKFYTLAFITANGSGEPAWGGIIPLSDDQFKDQIDTLRNNGGDVIVSFGGASGNELATVTSDVDLLVSKYQEVIDKYNLKWVDFDIEGAAVSNKESIDVRNKAIKILQEKNPELKIAFCLPALPQGLTTDGLYVIENAKDNGVIVDLVNVMAMDYGDGAAPNPQGQMGKYAIDSAEKTLDQIKGLGLDSKIGVTPMIGQNDVQSEVFTLEDAKEVLDWANSNNDVSLLSMWSATRDNGSGGESGTANATYSGIIQNEFDFINIFKNFK
ncbi:MAG: carbohydrate-binding protein [Clostridiales bacterium]